MNVWACLRIAYLEANEAPKPHPWHKLRAGINLFCWDRRCCARRNPSSTSRNTSSAAVGLFIAFLYI